MMDFSFDIPDTSQLNLVMGVGTQTQKMLDYCSTSVPLSPTVVYGSDQQQNQAASNINKKWDDTLRNNQVCVPPDSVQETETAPSNVHQEDKTNEEWKENEEAQKIISNVVDTVKQMESEGKHAISN
ncbi:hypothetical protein Hanom_Chr03g00206251 [Helianthus anomalus]